MTVFTDMYVCYCVGQWPSSRKKSAKIPEVLLFLAKKSTKQDGFGDETGFGD